MPSGEAAVTPASAGRGLPGVRIRIDAADPDGVGEIVIQTAARFSGYLGDPPMGPDVPLRTGDLGRVDDAGRLFVVDRRVDRIVRGGENIDPAEVEAILRAHPAVSDAAVVGRPDPTWGHVPVAAVVLSPGDADPDDAALAAHCRASLAGFKVPVAFLLDALPSWGRQAASRAVVPGGQFRRQ
jgi:acyl-CoA synthetase (AMP-forming)/AMP-acid ligase II